MKQLKLSLNMKKQELYNIATLLLRENKHYIYKIEELKIDMLSSLRTIRFISNTFEPRQEIFDDAIEDCDMIKPKSKDKIKLEGYQ